MGNHKKPFRHTKSEKLGFLGLRNLNSHATVRTPKHSPSSRLQIKKKKKMMDGMTFINSSKKKNNNKKHQMNTNQLSLWKCPEGFLCVCVWMRRHSIRMTCIFFFCFPPFEGRGDGVSYKSICLILELCTIKDFTHRRRRTWKLSCEHQRRVASWRTTEQGGREPN